VNTESRVVIYGATSTIAMEVAKLYAEKRAHLFLVARDGAKVEELRQDLVTRGATVAVCQADLTDFSRHGEILQQAVTTLGGIDVALLAHGTLSDQKLCETDTDALRREIDINFVSYASLLHGVASYLESRGAGTIVAISSVAGDRGRQSNYVYGSAKAGLSAFLQGLRNRLAPRGVHVVTVKPGFVSTKMTAHLKKNALFAEPSAVAQGIIRAVDGGRNVVYLPFFWCPIMMVIKSIPEWIFKRLKL